MPLQETLKHSKAGLSQSLVRSLGPGAHKVLLWPPRVCFPGGAPSFCQIPRLGNLLWAVELFQQCENFFGIIVLQFMGHLLSSSIVGLMVTSSKRTDATCQATQICCSQSPCPHSRSLLTCASTGDTQTLKCVSSSVYCEGHCSFPSVLVHKRICLHPLSVPGGSEI